MSEVKFDQIVVQGNRVESLDESPEILVQMFEESPRDDFRSSGGFGDRVEIELVRGESK